MRTKLRSTRFFGALTAGLVTLAIGIALTWTPPAEGKGKPGGGGGGDAEPVPEGTLYYGEESVGTWGVLADGTPVAQIPVLGGQEPSNLLYGEGYRLWLSVEETGETYTLGPDEIVTPQRDLFFYRDGAGPVQLTDLYGSFIVTGIPRWSNDGQDTLISFRGIDIRNGYDGNGHLDGISGVAGIFYIEITGSEIDADEPLIDVEEAVKTAVTGGSGSDFQHGWSADGKKVVYTRSDDLWVADLSGETTTTEMIWPASSWTTNPRFSPTTDKILVHHGIDVMTMNPDGSGAAVLVPGTPPFAYWSPDGNHVSFIEVVSKGFKKEYYLSRFSLTSGNVTRVTSGAAKTFHKSALPWVSNDFPL